MACAVTRPDAHRVSPGDVVDDFRLDDTLAEGGTSTTFRATSLTLERTVSLKYFHPETFLGDGPSLERARRDAASIARLEHPGISSVFAAGEWRGGLYVASALPSGPTLEERMQTAPLTPEEVASVIVDVAAALRHAHDAGTIHRDVRPDCIALGRWGNAQVRDFGVTRASGRTGLLTRAEVMESLRYTAPEVILGREASTATDTYALAATAVACLTGAPPFADRPPAQYVMLRTSAPAPRLAIRDGDVLPGLSRAIASGMALEPADRPAVHEFAASLRDAVAALPAELRERPAPLEAREVVGDEPPLAVADPAPAAAPAPQPSAPPAPNPADLTRVEQRRPVLASAQAAEQRVGWQTWATVSGVAATVGVIAALIAFLTAPATPAPIAVGGLEVTPPSGWMPQPGAATRLRAASAGGGTATLAVATGRLPGAPLSADIVQRTRPQLMRAGGVQVVLYGMSSELIVALPTTKGALYARCTPPIDAGRCAALVVQGVAGAKPVPVAPDRRASDALRAAMADVQQQGGIALGEMAAKKDEDRASGASALAGVLRNAAGTLTVEGVDPATAAALSSVAKALAAEAGALEQYSSALDRKSESAKQAARSAALAADARLRSALARFDEAGYEVQG